MNFKKKILSKLVGAFGYKLIDIEENKISCEKVLSQEKRISELEEQVLNLTRELSVKHIEPGGDVTDSLRYKNLLKAMHSILSDCIKLPDSNERRQILRNIKAPLKTQGYEFVEYDGSNNELFEIKPDCDCKKNIMVTPSLKKISTGEIIIKGVVFVPDND